jgi:hypothetical protein
MVPSLNADAIRAAVYRNFVEPKRERGEARISVRAGDVADALNLRGRMPHICGAIGALKFCREYGLELVARHGPQSGRNAVFVFIANTQQR